MKRSYSCFACGVMFILLTAVKMVSPAIASDLKTVVIPVLDHNDDFCALAEQIENIFAQNQSTEGELKLLESPLDRIQAILDTASENPMSDLPIITRTPKPESEPEPEVSATDPALQFGYQARETFLYSQAEITDSSPPENVSYDIIPLPFSESSPVNGYSSSGFGYRMHPILNELRFHYGTDFAADEGTEICAFADGVVLAVGEDDGYGSYVMLDHGDGFETLYGHCSALLVSEGDYVMKGTCIALVGSTGQATGPHLHFELLHDGVYLNPEFYLYA